MKITKQKLVLLILLFSLLMCKNSFSQLKNFGIKGGINISKINFELSFVDIQDLSKNRIGLSSTHSMIS